MSDDDSSDPCADPIETLRELFVDVTMGRRVARGQAPVARPVFLKPHGVVRCWLTIRSDLPADLRVGLFAKGSYEGWVRFSSDTLPSVSDVKTTLGVAIKLFGVDGASLISGGEEGTADFIFQNHDVFFVDDAREMCAFTWAGLKTTGGYEGYLRDHPQTQSILDEMQKTVDSVLDSPYWSVIPFALGSGPPVKYKLAPLHTPGAAKSPLGRADPDYLKADLRARAAQGESRFGLYVQRQLDPGAMPIDRATVRWDEAASPPILVAELTIPRQDVDAPGQGAWGENLSFNVWRTRAEHQPLGSIAEVRRVVYEAASRVRRERNGIAVEEPRHDRAEPAWAPPSDRRIVSAKIHPSIGIARVGNSDEYFLGPEVPDEPPPESARDAGGRLKRQAARFRIYGYNAAGEPVAELHAGNARIEWRAHLVNRKAAWYEFQLAQDIPEADQVPPCRLRNAPITDRAQLVIDPGPRSISGTCAGGPEHAFDGGRFLGQEVGLGELRTDEAGRLIVLGGRGRSGAPGGDALFSFANNDGWYDDVADGPVVATVILDDVSLPVDPAWVVVAPPNYAPGIKGLRTLWDELTDVFTAAGKITPPTRVSFGRDVYPIFARLFELGWVNAGFAEAFGPGGPFELLAPDKLARLASPAAADRELRNLVFRAFRDPEGTDTAPGRWPWIYGDSMDIVPSTIRANATVGKGQYEALSRWAAGDFDPDVHLIGAAPQALDALPIAEQPRALDRASLDHCLADAFHPGCEVTWPIRHATMFSAPYRIRHRPENLKEPWLGETLDRQRLEEFNGVLWGQPPGGLTRWMAVPWQADTASCRSGYEPEYDPYLPTFWPARVPNQVLSEEAYQRVVDVERGPEERAAAFRRREDWYRVLPGSYMQQVEEMVEGFWRLGVLERREPPADGYPIDAPLYVETLPPKLVGLLGAEPPRDAEQDASELRQQRPRFRARG